MAIIVNENTRVLVQGITGHQGSFHTKEMTKFGTNVVAGVTPGKGGMEVHGVPVYDSVAEAMTHSPNASMIAVPARFVKDAAYEALYNGIKVVHILTEGVPFHDTMEIIHYAKYCGATIIGPNSPGIASPFRAKVGIMPNNIFAKGNVGVVSRSGTLTYEIVNALTNANMGQSTVLGVGGDPVVGLSFVDVLEMFEKDDETKAVVIVGEIGGSAEEDAAQYITKHVSKPVVAYIAGRTAPPGKRMGHAGAIVTRGAGTAESKIKALSSAGVSVAKFPTEVPDLLKDLL